MGAIVCIFLRRSAKGLRKEGTCECIMVVREGRDDKKGEVILGRVGVLEL